MDRKYEFNSITPVKEKNNFSTKTVNFYLVYDLDCWPRNPPNNFILKNYLFAVTNIVKKVIKVNICNSNIIFLVAMEYYLMEQVLRVLVMILLGILQFLLFLIVPNLILIIVRIIF